jgi:PAS domain S-box-containing protein
MPTLPPAIYESAFNNSPIGEYLLTPTPEAIILAVNDAFLKTASRNREDLVGLSLFVAFPENPDDPEDTGVGALRKSLARVIATGEPDTLALQRYPIWITHPDGSKTYEERYWSAVSTPIFDEDGRLTCISHSTMDVTDLVALKHQSQAVEDKLARLEAGMFNRTQTVHEVNKALQEERSRLRHLFEHAPGFVYFTQGPRHVIEQANNAFYELVGARDIVGKTLREAFPDLKEQGFYDLHDQVYGSGQPYIAQAQRVVLQASPDAPPVERFIDLVYQPIVDAEGAVIGICGQGNDITEKRRIEETLRRSAARQAFQLELADRLHPLLSAEDIVATASEILGRHLDNSRVLYCEIDDPDGTFFIRRDWTSHGLPSVAGKVRRLDDFGPEVIADLRSGNPVLIHDVRLDRRSAAHAAAYENLGVRANLAIPLLKSGRLVTVLNLHQTTARQWTDSDVEMARDTAERTWLAVASARAQAQLRIEHDRNQAIFDNMTEGFVLVDRDWTILRMNAVGLRICQRTASEAIGRNHWEVWPETRDSEGGRLYQQVKATGIPGTRVYRQTFANGHTMWSEITAYPTLDGGLAAFFRDITDRQQAEESLRDSNRRKDEFLAMLAHELRNPLAPISAAAELMAMVRLDAARLEQTSQVIRRQVSHMTGLVDDLLDVSRVTRGLVTIRKAPQDLKGIISNAVEQIRPIMETHHHHLGIDLPPEPAHVSGDQKRLVQILTNLLNNAAKYTPPGGDIRLRMEIHDDKVLLHVSDDGIGIEPELQARVFDLFEQGERTADRSQGGLGLGLALVKSLAELHGGTVKCFSEGLGKGSCFTVCLPRLAAQIDASDRRQSLREVHKADKALRVLVVDDNVDAAEMLKMLLEASGHDVLVEHESRRALERAQQEVPDVCLLDIGLPDMDGNELASTLRARPETARAVLIAITGYGQEHDRKAALDAGFDHHLVKPIDTKSLMVLLTRIGHA